MAIHKIQSVYTVVNDMDAMHGFYSQLLGTPPKFRDADRWTQFGIGNTSFALSSISEAVPGDSGSIVVFESDHLDGVRELVERCGGSFIARRDMGAHGAVLSFRDPEGQPFQIFAKSQAAAQQRVDLTKEQS